MKTRIGTTSALAVMLVLGALGVMFALGQFNTNLIFADHATSDVSAVEVEAEPNDPGAIAKWTVEFTNNTDLVGGVDSIIIEFEDDVKIPTVIAPADVTITTTRFSNGTSSGATGTVVANPLGVNVRLVAEYGSGNSTEGAGNKDESEVTLEIGDMEPSTSTTGYQGIAGIKANQPSGTFNGGASAATVTVVFRQTAGITNPSEAKENASCVDPVTTSTQPNGVTATNCGSGAGGGAKHRLTGYDVRVATSKALDRIVAASTEGADLTAIIPRKVLLSDRDGKRGSNITVTGKGFKNSTTATIWLDTTVGGTRDNTETDLGSATVGSDDTFTASITVSNPPFGTTTSSNRINAIDGRSNRLVDNLTFANSLTNSTYTETTPTYKLESSVSATPTTAGVGDTVQIQAKDFTEGAINSTTLTITLGGVSVSVPSATISASGEGTFNIDVPNGVPSGSQDLKLTGTRVSAGTPRTTLTISPAVLTLTPAANLVPNQTLTVIGRGFTTGGGAEIAGSSTDTSSILIDGDSTGLKASGAAATNKVNEGNAIAIDNGGNWSSSIVLPINNTTVTPGAHVLKVIDDEGREGLTDLTIAPRSITLSPMESRVGTIVTVSGSGFPADNTKTGAASTPSISIKYTYSTTTDTVATLTPDASGNVSGTFTVPLNAPIPSTNSVKADFKYTPTSGSETTSTTAITHEIPRATVVISPVEGPVGTLVNVIGQGFKTYSTVKTLEIGGVDVRPAPVPSTDDTGSFVATVLVPQLNTGSQSVKGEVSTTVAASTFTVSAAAPTAVPVPVAAAAAPADALAVLISNNDNLQRVWHFDPSAQDVAPDFGWFLYDPRPVFAAANSVTEISGGKFYWINVREAQTAVLGGTSRALFAGWNPVTW